MKTFGFIGCGNMGSALAAALAMNVPPKNIYVSDPAKEKAAEFCERLGCSVSGNDEIARVCDYIFLAVKPQVLPAVLGGISRTLEERTSRFVLVSMAAGVSTDNVTRMCGAKYPLIRIMPNLPVSVGKGLVLYCTNGLVAADEESFFREAMSRAGTVDPIEEKLIDAASAVSGCGPAFVFMFAQAMADGAVRCGLPRGKALEYALLTAEGSAEYALRSGKHPEELKDAVCSPGGSTIEGVTALEDGAFRASVIEAVCRSFERTKELGK